MVRRGNGQFPQFFKWNDITNLVNHKRYFGVECQSYDRSAQFLLDESDSAKYVWKMCVLQHTFYKMHSRANSASNGDVSNELNITINDQHHPPTPSATAAATGTGYPDSWQMAAAAAAATQAQVCMKEYLCYLVLMFNRQ